MVLHKILGPLHKHSKKKNIPMPLHNTGFYVKTAKVIHSPLCLCECVHISICSSHRQRAEERDGNSDVTAGRYVFIES